MAQIHLHTSTEQRRGTRSLGTKENRRAEWLAMSPLPATCEVRGLPPSIRFRFLPDNLMLLSSPRMMQKQVRPGRRPISPSGRFDPWVTTVPSTGTDSLPLMSASSNLVSSVMQVALDVYDTLGINGSIQQIAHSSAGVYAKWSGRFVNRAFSGTSPSFT